MSNSTPRFPHTVLGVGVWVVGAAELAEAKDPERTTINLYYISCAFPVIELVFLMQFTGFFNG